MKDKIKIHNKIVNSKFPIDPFTMYINENFKTVEEMDKIVEEFNKGTNTFKKIFSGSEIVCSDSF